MVRENVSCILFRDSLFHSFVIYTYPSVDHMILLDIFSMQ